MIGLTAFQPRYRELVIYKTFSALRAEASRTYLSFLWWAIDPILSMTIYYLVFAVLFERGSENYVAFLLVGLVTWQWFSNSIAHGCNAINGNGRIISQVNLPKELFPTIDVLQDFIKFSAVLILLILLLWIMGYPATPAYLALPFLIIVEFLLILSVTYFVAAIVPFLPDLKHLVLALLHLAFFLSGIFFSGSEIPVDYQPYFYLNPMANLIEAYRAVLIYGEWPNWDSLLIVGCISLFGAYLSQALIRAFNFVYPRIVIS